MPKEAKRLNDKQVAALKTAGHYPVGGDGAKGLAIKVVARKNDTNPAAVSRSWVLRVATGETRISSTGNPFAVRRDFGLGSYPEVSLSEARNKAADIRAQLRLGIDPTAQKKAAKAEAARQKALLRTFADVARDCYAVREKEFKNRKHAAQWINTLETYAFPVVGVRPIADIGVAELVEILKPIWTEKHATADRLRQRIASVIDYAAASGLRSGLNPAEMKNGLGELLPKAKAVKKKAGTSHHPRIAVDDMPRFMADLMTREAAGAKALTFAILTAARSGEVRGATWGEIDLKAREWRLSAERMKADRAHKVPLSDAATALLESLPRGSADDFLFSGRQGQPLSDMTLSKLMKDMHTAQVKSHQLGYTDPDQRDRVATPHGTARSTFKDWSRKSTARVMADGNRSSFPDEWAELALAHVNSDTTRAAYARDELLDERRELMQVWATYCVGGAI